MLPKRRFIVSHEVLRQVTSSGEDSDMNVQATRDVKKEPLAT